jgi:hypothetical protein
LNAFEASFYYLTFIDLFFTITITNGGFFEVDVIFEKKKSTFFRTGRSHPKINLFQILKNNSVVQRPKIYQKKLPKKILQNGGVIQDGVWTTFLNKIIYSESFNLSF